MNHDNLEFSNAVPGNDGKFNAQAYNCVICYCYVTYVMPRNVHTTVFTFSSQFVSLKR